MKSLKTIGAMLVGFLLSFIPNNFMNERYENLAFYIVLGLSLFFIIKENVQCNGKEIK
jgi:hypothetical protein